MPVPFRPPSTTATKASPAGAALRRFRVGAGLSTRALARRLGVAASYVSKVELGQLRPDPSFCERAGRALRLGRADTQLLHTLSVLQTVDYTPIGASAVRLATVQRAILRLEHVARSIRVFQLSLIPGLLQTREYMMAIFRRIDPVHARQATAQRLARQTVLQDRTKRFEFVIADWALGPHWCSPALMARQRRALLQYARRENVQVAIVGSDTSLPRTLPPLVTGFEIIDRSLVVQDGLTGFTTIRDPDAVRYHIEAVEAISGASHNFLNWAPQQGPDPQ